MSMSILTPQSMTLRQENSRSQKEGKTMSNRSCLLRVGVVGCGGFGRNAYVNNIIENPDASLVALCDIDLTQAEAAAREVFDEGGREPRPALYPDYQAMIDQESLDVVMVGTMADVRPYVAIYALNAGAHVLAAKPMAPSLAEAEEMLQTAKEANRILMVGYNFRFRDDAQVVHRFIRDGGIGPPRFARAWSFAASVPIRGSHYKAASGGGSLARTGVHTMDLAIWFLGNPPLISVHGRAVSRFADLPALPSELEPLRGDYDDPDLVSGYVHFADGVTLSVGEYVDGTAADRRSRRRGMGDTRLRFGDTVTIADLAGRRLRRCNRAGCSGRCQFFP